ncbi:MAG: rod shape-determining protein MreD [Alistipes sp.]|nr:rod shape-determining protein MreD [Alistipes sp.]
MHRTAPYILLIVLALLQIFLFNNLAISTYFSPLVYLIFLVMLPLETSGIAMLALGLITGMMMDYTMGTAGINTFSTLFVAFFRRNLISLFANREDLRDEGIPSPARMGVLLFWSYAIAMVLLHHTIFFVMESLSWAHFGRTLLRILLSSAGTLCALYLTEQLFTPKLSKHA